MESFDQVKKKKLEELIVDYAESADLRITMRGLRNLSLEYQRGTIGQEEWYSLFDPEFRRLFDLLDGVEDVMSETNNTSKS